MAKLGKNMYTNAKGEKKLNCYNINIPKAVVSETNISDKDKINIYAKDNKIIIEKA